MSKKIQRKYDDFLTSNKRESVLREISQYFKEEHELDIGIISAEDILDFFLQEIGEDIHNKAIENTRAIVVNSMENIEIDLAALISK